MFNIFNVIWIFNTHSVLIYEDTLLLRDLDSFYQKYVLTRKIDFGEIIYSFYHIVPKLIFLPVYLLFGPLLETSFLINLFFFNLSLFFLFKTIRLIYSQKTALYSLFFLLALPTNIIITRFLYPVDFLFFFYSLSLYLLIRTEKFAKRGYSILYGIVLGLFGLTKHTAYPYILAQFLFILYENRKSFVDLLKNLWEKRKETLMKLSTKLILFLVLVFLEIKSQIFLFHKHNVLSISVSNMLIFGQLVLFIIIMWLFLKLIIWSEKKKINNILDSLSMFFFVNLFWNIPNLFFRFLQTEDKILLFNHISFESLSYYFGFFVERNGILLFIITLFLISYFLFKVEKKEKDVLFTVLIIIPYLFYSVYLGKEYIALLMIFIPLSVIVGRALSQHNMRKYASIFLFIFLFLAFFYNNPYQTTKNRLPDILGTILGVKEEVHQEGFISRREIYYLDHNKKIFEKIEDSLPNNITGTVNILVLGDEVTFNRDVLNHYAMIYNPSIYNVTLFYSMYNYSTPGGYLKHSDYVIISRPHHLNWFFSEEEMSSIISYVGNNDLYELIHKEDKSRNISAFVFKKNSFSR